jgi:hypothetical protein
LLASRQSACSVVKCEKGEEFSLCSGGKGIKTLQDERRVAEDSEMHLAVKKAHNEQSL